MGGQVIKLNALVELLHSHDPGRLQEMKGQFPDQQNLFDPGLTMGDEDNKNEATLAHVSLAVEALSAVDKEVEPKLHELKSRLAKAQKMRVTSQIITSITSAGLLGAILSDTSKTVTIITACINFASAIITILAGYMEKPKHGGTENNQDILQSLIQAKVNAKRLITEFQTMLATETLSKEVISKLQEANVLASDLRLAAYQV